jgi:hypothetical protein
MKANELRIGNYVLIPSHSDKSKPLVPCIEKRVKGINMFGELDFTEPTYPENHLVHTKHCMGIPLTEDWLLKLGFELDTYNNFFKNEIYFNIIDCNTIQLSSCGFGVNGFGQEIKYVHQLQNLYFALTGSELTIKL